MEPWAGPELDTIQPRRCGCVPQLSLVYEDKSRGGEARDEGGWEDPGGGGSPPDSRGGWARRIPLLGPFWCVRGSATTTIRRRDNAVYRSNSFKFERRAPEESQDVKASSVVPVLTKPGLALRRSQGRGSQTVETAKVAQAQPRPPLRSRNRHKEPMVNLNYSDPQDAEPDFPGLGNVNQAYEGEDLQEPHDKHVPAVEPPGKLVRLGQEIYYCKPYRPFHTQLRYNFSDLLESGVDSEYEEMAGQRAPKPGQAAPCSQCVTVINVRSSPGHTLQQRQLPQPLTGDFAEPPYENLAFHKVTISVPDVGEELPHPHHHLMGEKPRVLLRKPPLKKSKVPLKYQGIKRVKSKSKTQLHDHGGLGREGGYSQKEVWNWLYLEEEGQGKEAEEEEEEEAEGDRGVSVQFSPAEFLQATNRLAHLNLEGFERFVGSTIDRALAGARTKSSDPLESRLQDQEQVEVEEGGEPLYLRHEAMDMNTDMYVGQEGGEGRRTGCGDCKSKVRPVCESCLRSGESSCSSALSSLESVKSSQGSGGSAIRTRESDSSARGSYLSSDTPTGDEARQEYMRMTPANAQSYVRLADNGQRIYRGRVRASLPLGTAHKPYQTLEVGQQQEKTMSRGSLGPGLCLVDPAIQLHQQEWYHGNVSRIEAETALRLQPPGSYLIRNCESARKDYSLSLNHGYMHMRIQLTPSGHYILGQFSRPFASIADMVNYYTVNRLPIKGAEHVSLKTPLCEQLL